MLPTVKSPAAAIVGMERVHSRLTDPKINQFAVQSESDDSTMDSDAYPGGRSPQPAIQVYERNVCRCLFGVGNLTSTGCFFCRVQAKSANGPALAQGDNWCCSRIRRH